MSWKVRQPPDERRERKSRLWRRRALLKKGARLHARMNANADHGSLAMLDEEGVVVSWYGGRRDDTSTDRPLDHHVSQFYVPEDVALGVPTRDLCTAAIHGISTQEGWRRAADGSIGWAMTQIDAEVLRDGRLQGFAHVVRRLPGAAQARSDLPRPLATMDVSNTDSPSTSVVRLAESVAESVEILDRRRLARSCE